MVYIVFDQSFPQPFRATARALIREVELLLPVWIQQMYVEWEPIAQGRYASMSVDKAYRRMSLVVTPELIMADDDTQHLTMLHEVMHCFNSPIADVAEEILDRMFPMGEESETEAVKDLYIMFKTRLSEAMEGVNTDFTFSLIRYRDELLGKKNDVDGGSSITS